jgi:hypothetical protein
MMKSRRKTVFWLESLNGRDHMEEIGVDGRIILNWILGEIMVGGCGLDLSGLGYGLVAGSVMNLGVS